jgi:hypothetical protein
MDEQSNSTKPVMTGEAPSLENKIVLCAVAWFVGIIGIGIVEGGQFSWAGVFYPPMLNPVGIAALIFCGSTNEGWILSLFSGWAYYIAMTIWCLWEKRRVVFRWVFAILCISMLLNMAGCEAVKHMKFGC